MQDNFKLFQSLHHRDNPLLIGNVWNVKSAQLLEQSGYEALGTSSYAIAESMGYEDGGNMPFDLYFAIIERIAKNIIIPLSVDLEGGYGATADQVIDNIIRLHEIGVVGINLEDSLLIDGQRILLDPYVFNTKLKAIIEGLKSKGVELFINLRCDAFLLNHPDKLNETKKRITLYETNDIHGIFLPCMLSFEDIDEIVDHTKLPLNLLGLPGLPGFDKLKDHGVKRISIGDFVYAKIYGHISEEIQVIKDNQNFNSLFKI